MRNYSYHWGKLLFVRWLVVSWTLQAIHVLDKRERTFRIILELIPLTIIAVFAFIGLYSWWFYLVCAIIVHTIFWLLDSTWLVGFREVYSKFRGKGLQSVINYVDWSIKVLQDCDNISAIAIYGSICRRKYHDRSDFDLRILQESYSLKTLFKMIQLRIVAIYKYRIPIDLKLVDSVEFLKKEMRRDEHPIVPYNKYKTFYNEGDSYEILKANPKNYLRDK
jgi:hypothetical protein